MNNPYKVLGVSQDAEDEDIKKAYRALSRKYHPDANVNNPMQAEAEARFKEVQQAYQQIMAERENGQFGGEYQNAWGFGGFAGYGQSSAGGGEEDSHLRAAASYIQGAHYKEALNVLEGIRDRGALWCFYSASANSGLGNNVTALERAREAVRLEPGNIQYQVLLNRLEGGGAWYEQRQSMYGFPSIGGNSLCVKLCIANALCNMCCASGCCGNGGYGGRYF